MKKIGLFVLMLCLGICVFGQAKTTIKGNVKNDKMKSVELYVVEEGCGRLLTTTEVGADGSYQFTFTSEKPGFYLLGDNRWSFPVYAKGGEEVNINLTQKTAHLTGKNTKENRALYMWEELAGTLNWMSSSAFSGETTYKEVFPELTRVLGQVEGLKKKINSGNKAFDELLGKKMDYDLDYYAISLIMSPRSAHPERNEWLPYYQAIVSDKKFTTDEVLLLPRGIAMMSAYMNFAGMISSPAPAPGIDAMKNDRLKGELLLVRLQSVKLRSACASQIQEFGKYLVTEDQKKRAAAILDKFPPSLDGKPAPAFTYPDVNGKNVSLSDFKGKVVLIDIWATWCGPCVREVPALKKLEEELKGKDVVFMGISIDDAKSKQKWLDFVEKEQLHGVQLNTAYDGKLLNDYSVTGIPRFIVIDKKGNVAVESAPKPSNPALKEMIEKELVE